MSKLKLKVIIQEGTLTLLIKTKENISESERGKICFIIYIINKFCCFCPIYVCIFLTNDLNSILNAKEQKAFFGLIGTFTKSFA
jgi:hypothetical protein